MTRKLLKLCGLLSLFGLLFLACRTDTELVSEIKVAKQEKITAFTNLKIKSSGGSQMGKGMEDNYAYPFAEIISNFMADNPDYHEEFLRKFGEINLKVSSQTFDDEDKYVYFPIMRDKKFEGILACKITKNLTFASFRIFDKSNKEVKDFVSGFNKYFGKKKTGSDIFAREDEGPETPIEEVIIIYHTGSDTTYHLPFDSGTSSSGSNGAMDGDSNTHNDNNTHGGGNNGDENNDSGNPCALIKSQNDEQKYKNALEYLYDKTNQSSESGFGVGIPDKTKDETESNYDLLQNIPGTSDLKFSYLDTTYGVVHSHHDNLIPIFSPDDINEFIKLLKNAKKNNIPTKNVFLTVVTSQANYQLRGDGINVDNLHEYSESEIAKLNANYKRSMDNPTITAEKLQAKFLEFMKDNMNIDGAKLYLLGKYDNSELQLKNGKAKPIACS